MDEKIWFIFSLYTGGWISCSISITSNFSFISSGVILKPFLCRFIWNLSVAGDLSGRYFPTAVAVRPGHVANGLFWMALMSVCLVGHKRNWWRYLIRSPLEVIWYMLPAYCVPAVLVWKGKLSGGVPGLSGRILSIVDGYRGPCHTIVLLYKIRNLSLSYDTLQPALHNIFMDTKEVWARLGKNVPVWLPQGYMGDLIFLCVDCSIFPFG